VKALVLNIAALVSLIPGTLAHRRRAAGRDGVFWTTLAVAIAGSVSWTAAMLQGGWHTGFAVALWVGIVASLLVFAATAALARQAWRLAPLMLGYLVLLALVATVWAHAPERPLSPQAPAVWLRAHIIVSLLTFGLLTNAAVAGTAVLLREWALKAKRRAPVIAILPAVTECERLEFALVAAGEVVLGLGLLTGMATLYLEQGRLLTLDHKTVLSLLAFAVIAALIAAHRLTGVRGRRAARGLLVAYALVMLAYPGVKFVTDVLIG